jgi:hypothetical protein
MVCANNANFASTMGITIDDVDHFIVSRGRHLIMFDDYSYKELYRIDLNLPLSSTREPIMVISMKSSDDGQYIALSVGKNLITGIEEILQIIIMRRDADKNEYSIIKRIDMVKEQLTDVCKRIQFD